ncbi:MAG: Single-stranded DNA-binding protein [Firmicutes bacterium]|nr:Single-stranded DNA-binding protein [Bacillota bacterium]MDI6705003.1 single-stranded DNA-binding protein [Bacillota bacterium]
MLNKVCLVGRLTRDPELRFIPGSGTPVASFTLAVDRSFKNKQGEREADFIGIVVWSKLAELCANYLSKGRLVAVSGRIQSRSWEDEAGKRRYMIEVVADEVSFLDRGTSNPNSGNIKGSNQDDFPQDDDFFPIEDDPDLPF